MAAGFAQKQLLIFGLAVLFSYYQYSRMVATSDKLFKQVSEDAHKIKRVIRRDTYLSSFNAGEANQLQIVDVVAEDQGRGETPPAPSVLHKRMLVLGYRATTDSRAPVLFGEIISDRPNQRTNQGRSPTSSRNGANTQQSRSRGNRRGGSSRRAGSRRNSDALPLFRAIVYDSTLLPAVRDCEMRGLLTHVVLKGDAAIRNSQGSSDLADTETVNSVKDLDMERSSEDIKGERNIQEEIATNGSAESCPAVDNERTKNGEKQRTTVIGGSLSEQRGKNNRDDILVTKESLSTSDQQSVHGSNEEEARNVPDIEPLDDEEMSGPLPIEGRRRGYGAGPLSDVEESLSTVEDTDLTSQDEVVNTDYTNSDNSGKKDGEVDELNDVDGVDVSDEQVESCLASLD